MAPDGPSVYRGATREAAERAYHADARANLRAGYVPASEVWSTALAQHVLTVAYVYAPDQAPAVLDALASAEIEAARPASPVPAPGGQSGFAAVRLPEPPMPAAAAPDKRSPLGLIVTVIVALVALGGVLSSQGMLSLPTAPGLPLVPDAGNLPPAGQVWFGRSFDPSTFAVQLRLNSAGANDAFVAVATLPRAVDAAELQVRAYFDGQLVASQQINATGFGDIWGVNLGPLFAAGVWRYEFADIGGNVLASGSILIQ